MCALRAPNFEPREPLARFEHMNSSNFELFPAGVRTPGTVVLLQVPRYPAARAPGSLGPDCWGRFPWVRKISNFFSEFFMIPAPWGCPGFKFG